MSSRRIHLPGLVLLGLLAAVTGAWAQSQAHITLQSLAEVEQTVLDQEGRSSVKRVPATKVTPGTEVIFTILYENVSQQAVENAVITNPIPEQMLFREGSAGGGGALITYSVDHGQSYDLPAKLFLQDQAGRKFPARAQDYTHVRWTFETPLPPGAKGEVSFRAVLK